MKKLSLEQRKKYLLGILNEIDSFCKKKHIQYSLSAGTLLGAVRHRGFIPWDDDIDIMMLTEDYDYFKANFESEFYKIASYETKNNYGSAFVKVEDIRTVLHEPRWKGVYEIGINVDVFPIVACSESKINAMQMIDTKNKYYHLNSVLSVKRKLFDSLNSVIAFKSFIKSHIFKLLYRHGKDETRKIITDLPSLYFFDDSDYVVSIYGMYGYNEIFPKEWFLEYTTISFEGKEYMCIREYEKYLHQIYDDYMTPPPEKDRKSKHNATAYVI